MILTVLGSGTIHPDPHRGGPSYLLSHDDVHLMLDAGPVATRGLRRAGLSPVDLEGVCITHRHPDHVCELGLLLELGKTLGRTRPLWLAGPEILDTLIAFLMTWARRAPKQLPYRIKRLVLPGTGRVGPFRITGAPVPHVEHSVGLRIEAGGRTLVYPGDCGPGAPVADLARDCDLLVLECTLAPGERSAAHLAPEDAARIARRAGCRRLLLSHFKPGADVDAALAICTRQGIGTTAATDGATFLV